ncbi:MAG TPA: hypothetical protein VM283_03920 [Armatimonadota bacterium]|nr:hypothetical protein [Armatimonadota bacterium]
MWRTACACIIAAAALSLAAAQEGSVYLRGADGSWTKLEAQVEGGVVHFTLTPEQVPDGRATVVINKPEWMVLEDDQPPAVIAVTVDGQRTELAAGDAIDLGERSSAPAELIVEVADDKNPVDPESVAVVAGGTRLPARVAASDLPLTAKGGTVTLSLEDVLPGIYEGALHIADLSPQRNTASVPLRLSVFGVSVAPGNQSVRLSGGGRSYEVLPEGQKFIVIGEGGPSVYLSTQIHGQFYYVNELAEIEELPGDEHSAGVRIFAGLRDIDKKIATDQEAGAEISYDVRLQADLGCLLVTGRVKNIGAAGPVYCFWGWLPGDGYVTPDGEHHQWTMKYERIGQVGWVFVPSTREGMPGVGWISPMEFGESRFGTMLTYTVPTNIDTQPGDVVTTDIAVMTADSAEEVAAVAAKLAEMGWPE